MSNLKSGLNTKPEPKGNSDGKEIQKYVQPRLVKLSEINQSDYENLPNRHVIVKVVWRSVKSPPNSKTPCRVILSDETGHIGAILFLSRHIHTNNLYNKLKPGSRVLKLQNFSVEEEVPENFRIIKHQSKQLKLSQSTTDLKEITNFPGNESFLSYLPIDLTSLEDVDDRKSGSFVDIIGHAKYISEILTSKKDANVQYQKVALSTHSSDSPAAEDDEFFRYLTLFGGHIGKIKTETTYILQNVKVDYFEYENSNSVKTTALSIAHEIHSLEDLRTLVPPNCLTSSQVENLFVETSSREQYPAVCASSNPNVSAGSLKRPLPPSHQSQQSSRKLQKVEVEPGSETTPDTVEQEDDHEEFPESVTYDFINCMTPLKVKVLPAKKFKGARNKAYTMRSERRGIALVLNNYYFPHKGKDTLRKGSQNDVVYLEQFLSSCKFDVTIKDNISSKELSSVLNDFKDKAANEIDCCFVAILSHGLFGGIEMVDGELVNLYSDIVYQFDDYNFPIFKDKPKIFLVQACQNMPSLGSLQKWNNKSTHHSKVSLDNTIVCHATIPEVSAHRDIYLGSPFIYVFVHTLMNHAHDRHFLEIYHEVRKRLKNVKRSKQDPLNCSSTDFGFKKFLYFNPGL